MKTLIRLVMAVIVIAGLLYVGACIYGNVKATTRITPLSPQQTMPDATKAPYAVYIAESGALLLSSDYEQAGDQIGKRIFVLHGFWELSGQKWIQKKADIILNESVLGEIQIKRRTP